MNACDFAVLGMGASTSLGWWVASTYLWLCSRLSIAIFIVCAPYLTDHPSIHPLYIHSTHRWICMRERRREEEGLKRVMAMQGFKPMSELPAEEQG